MFLCSFYILFIFYTISLDLADNWTWMPWDQMYYFENEEHNNRTSKLPKETENKNKIIQEHKVW